MHIKLNTFEDSFIVVIRESYKIAKDTSDCQ